MSWCTKSFDETKYMYFLIEDNNFLKKIIKSWNKFSNSIKNGFDSMLEESE